MQQHSNLSVPHSSHYPVNTEQTACMSGRVFTVPYIPTPWGDGTNLFMEINTHRVLRMIHSLQYPTQWIRKVVPDKHLNNILWTSAFQTKSYATVWGNKRGNGRSSLPLRGSMALIYISQNLTDITSLRLKA